MMMMINKSDFFKDKPKKQQNSTRRRTAEPEGENITENTLTRSFIVC